MSADLSHAKLTALLATTFAALPEHRRGKHCVYTLADAAWAAFTVFFTQARSFLARWRDARRPNGRANARKLWGEHQTPSDPQTRNLLDPLAPTHFYTPLHHPPAAQGGGLLAGLPGVRQQPLGGAGRGALLCFDHHPLSAM